MLFGARAYEPHFVSETAWIISVLTAAVKYFLGYFTVGFTVSGFWLVSSILKKRIFESLHPLNPHSEK